VRKRTLSNVAERERFERERLVRRKCKGLRSSPDQPERLGPPSVVAASWAAVESVETEQTDPAAVSSEGAEV